MSNFGIIPHWLYMMIYRMMTTMNPSRNQSENKEKDAPTPKPTDLTSKLDKKARSRYLCHHINWHCFCFYSWFFRMNVNRMYAHLSSFCFVYLWRSVFSLHYFEILSENIIMLRVDCIMEPETRNSSRYRSLACCIGIIQV